MAEPRWSEAEIRAAWPDRYRMTVDYLVAALHKAVPATPPTPAEPCEQATPARCACGKPVAHLDADEDSNEWACQTPAAGEAPPAECDCPGCGWSVDCWHRTPGGTG